MAQEGWIKRNQDGFITGLIVCVVWAGLGYLKATASTMFAPLFYGFMGGAAVVVCSVAISILRRISPGPPVSSKNIEGLIRKWLDNFKVTVKSDPGSDLYFRFHLTLDSGFQMTVLRSKTEHPEYFSIIAQLGMSGEEAKKVLGLFTEGEIAQLLVNLKIELARAKVGYGGLQLPPDNFHVFRRVPILPGLTEFIFMSMVFDIECAVSLVLQTLANARLKQITPLPGAAENRFPKTAEN